MDDSGSVAIVGTRATFPRLVSECFFIKVMLASLSVNHYNYRVLKMSLLGNPCNENIIIDRYYLIYYTMYRFMEDRLINEISEGNNGHKEN